ncbi:MAG TPA: DinB family protein [Chitinophagaceae bacterium]|nr:DinB family protein [Chitinophagaceae bacterium]
MQTLTTRKRDFDQIINLWLENLDQYDFIQLLAKPSATSWSMGQLYMHLIQSTHFFIKQVRISTSNNENINLEAFAAAREMFSNNELPDTFLEGPPSNAITPQPVSKEDLRSELLTLKEEIKTAEVIVSQSQFTGKTRHFGLGYFTAQEWLQFAEMHLRHHLRQKKRLDEFLKTQVA